MIQVYAINGKKLSAIATKQLPQEDDLQRWIAEDPSIIGLNLLVLGREVKTEFGGKIDVLGLDIDGNLVVIECKRAKTPREIVAQLLDYGSWVARLNTKQVHALAKNLLDTPLATLFSARFATTLPENLNLSHSLMVVATEFDAASRRIIEYLAEIHGLSINAIFFSSFVHANQDLLAIEWLLDQEEVTQRAESKVAAPWTGLSYFNVGQTEERHWEDMRKYEFISAGGGPAYVSGLKKLTTGDGILAYQKQTGYVGYGVVTSEAVQIDNFLFNGEAIINQTLSAPSFGHDIGDLSRCEFLVGVDWKRTYSLSEAKTFKGIFTNPLVVCKLRNPATIDFLSQRFPIEVSSPE